MSAGPELRAPTGASLPPTPGLEAVLDSVADGVRVLKRPGEGCVAEWASRRFHAASGRK